VTIEKKVPLCLDRIGLLSIVMAIERVGIAMIYHR
jgi:hypothetical protein